MLCTFKINWRYVRWAHMHANWRKLVHWVLGKYFLENLLSSSCQVHLEQKCQKDRTQNDGANRIEEDTMYAYNCKKRVQRILYTYSHSHSFSISFCRIKWSALIIALIHSVQMYYQRCCILCNLSPSLLSASASKIST